MRLLFDQNLSFKLVNRLSDLFPNSTQVRLVGMDQSDDPDLWAYALNNEYVIVTQDIDFFERSALYGSPPKVIWLRCGNQRTAFIEQLLRDSVAAIQSFENDAAVDCLELA
jgi:predicted nuclease of predicted toxin-antitoxin system